MTSEHLPRLQDAPVEHPFRPAPPGERISERIVYLEAQPARRSLVDHLLRATLVLGLLLVVALLAGLFAVVLSLAGLGHQLSGGLNGVSSALGRVDNRVAGVAQGLSDRVNPAHPPRSPLSYDPEFDDLRVFAPGSELGRTESYVYTLGEIAKRDAAGDPNTAQYAVIHRAYITPHETKLLGKTVRVDRGEATYYVYKGESFGIGRGVYKVNWISPEQNQLALARYRNSDTLTTTLKFRGP